MAVPAAEAEGIFIVYVDGPDPDLEEGRQIMAEFERQTKICLAGNQLSPCRGDGDLTEGYARHVVDMFEGQGKLSSGAASRTVIRTVIVNGTQRIVAAVLAKEFNTWVRELIPRHLERLAKAGDPATRRPAFRLRAKAGDPTTRRPAFRRLGSDPAVSFVAGARDGQTLQLEGLQITVSLFAETDPKSICASMPGGSYTRLITELGIVDALATAGSPADRDIAHWLVCADGRQQIVHLGYFTPPNRGGGIIFPHDLMTPEEQQWLGRSII